MSFGFHKALVRAAVYLNSMYNASAAHLLNPNLKE